MLNRESPLPLYAQLAEHLSTQIREGHYAPGTRLPSEPQLANTFRIGRPTVRQATDVLISRRLIERRRGSGTFVLERPTEVDLFSVAGTLASFKAKGLSLESELVENVTLLTVQPAADHPLSGKLAYRFTRVSRLMGGPAERGSRAASSRRTTGSRARSSSTPVLLERFLLEASVFAGIERMDLGGRSLAQLVRERFYLEPTSGQQSFQVSFLDGKLAQAMNVSSQKPLLCVRRSLSFERAPDALYSELYCRTDLISFTQEMGAELHG